MSLRSIYVIAFGIVGILARYYCGILIGKTLNSPLPVATFCINILGSFVIGIIYVLGVERSVLSEDLRIGIMVGLLGGFTTFSAYCLETLTLTESKDLLYAIGYLTLSPVLGVASTFVGMILARKI